MQIVTSAIVQNIPKAVDPNLTFNRLDQRTRRDGRQDYQVTLRVNDSHGKYARRSYTGRRMVSACWHGHYDFMKLIYATDPDAIIRSAFATYNGQDDFYAKADATGGRNIGSMARPMLMEDACDCEATS